MESVGEYLRRERTLRGVSLSRIHEATRIPLKTLEGLEKDDYEGLPHPTFVKGFIKTYCKFLGLDETDALLRHELHLRETGEAEKPAPKPEKTATWGLGERRPSSIRNALILVAGGVFLIIAFYAVSVLTRGRETPPGENVVPPASHPISEDWKLPASQGKELSGGPGRVPDAGLEPHGGAAVPGEAKKGAAPERHTLTVHAKENTWVEVSIDGGKPFDVLLKNGEKITWEALETISLVVGNAGGVKLLFDGEVVPLSGKSGEVLRLKFPS